MGMLCGVSNSLAFVTLPREPRVAVHHHDSPVIDMSSASRRAVVTTILSSSAAIFPLSAFAASVVEEEATLDQQKQVVQAIDRELKKEEAVERAELTQLKELEDATLKAMSAGNKAEVKRLEAKARALK